jgi:hypothetical protein
MNAALLIESLPDGRPPRGSKLGASTWYRAADLFAAHDGKVRLRIISEQCHVSHKTAWRLRETLRDAAQVIREQNRRAVRTASPIEGV